MNGAGERHRSRWQAKAQRLSRHNPFALTARDRTTAYVRQAPAASDQKDCRHVGIDGLGDREARAKAERSAGFLGRTLKGSTGRCDALKQGEIKQVDGAKLVAGMEEQLLIAG
jgi:hypothetical protein